jgi:phosphatidylglycerophosphate synthase
MTESRARLRRLPMNRRDRNSVIRSEGPDGYGGAVRTVRVGAALGGLITPALLGCLALTTGLDAAGWAVGLVTGWSATALLVAARARSDRPAILPADWVTLTRALLIAGVAALVGTSFGRPVPVGAVVALASIALALDAVDGPVARRTGTATPLGARFDGEVDALLLLVLSIEVSRDYGLWVVAIGALRYALLFAGWVVRWLAAPLPPRYWRKVVTAVQGIALAVAASGLLPRTIGMIAVGGALALLAESFGRDVIWLYRRGAGTRTRLVLRRATALVAAAIVWAVLVAPDRLDRLTPAAFARIPVEALALIGVGLLLPPRPRRVLAGVAGFAFGLLAVVKVFNVGFYEELGRPFDPVLDWGNLGPAIGVVRDSIGNKATNVLLVLVLLGLVLLIALVTAATLRISTVTARHRSGSARGLVVLGLVWAISAALSLQVAPGVPMASTSDAALAVAQVRDAYEAVQDQQRFETEIHARDPYAAMPSSDLLTELRGKDVIVAFVESYGQVAVQNTSFSPGVDRVLRSGTDTLSRAGYEMRSAFLDSPTFGGISWLAHSTLQSGLWVDNQQRYDQLMGGDRFTLARAFSKAGWRTVSDIPSDDWTWPDGRTFYHYDQLYDRRNVGYLGPSFSYAAVPDQYSLAAFQRLELAPAHQPVMAEIDLVSSHTPWTPLPTMVPWDQLGDGSIFYSNPTLGPSPDVAWRNSGTVQKLYGQSIQYSMRALTSWVARLHDDNLVLILLGDHQPATTVSGADANHQVPISVVAHDPDVLARIDSWHWQDGLLPSHSAPVWPMDAFRNRFLDAFSSTSTAAAQRPSP